MSDDSNLKVAVLGERIDGHEKVCAERYGQINGSFERIHSRLDWIMRGVIGLLLSMVGWLLIKGVPWPGIGQ